MNNLNLPPFELGKELLYIKKYANNPKISYPPINTPQIIVAKNFTYFGEWHYQIKGYEVCPLGGEQWFVWENFVEVKQTKFPPMTFEKIKESSPEILINN